MGISAGLFRRAVGTVAVAATIAVVVPVLDPPPAAAGTPCLLLGVPLGCDSTPPESEITSAPPAETGARSAAFEYTTNPAEAGASFECRLDGEGTVVEDWTDCTTTPAEGATSSDGRKTYRDLAIGTYTFSVRATDDTDHDPLRAGVQDGNAETTPATHTWQVVDLRPPQTRITNAPGFWRTFTYAGLNFSSDEVASGFRCTFDGRPVDCSSGRRSGSAYFLRLRPGDHVFSVRATDTSGNTDPSPARARFTVPRNNTALTHSKGWRRLSGRGYFDDSYSVTRRKGATLTVGASGVRRLALVASTCPRCGKVRVSLGGRTLKTVALTSARARHRRVLPVASFKGGQRGRIKVEVVSSGKDVVIEGIGVSRRR